MALFLARLGGVGMMGALPLPLLTSARPLEGGRGAERHSEEPRSRGAAARYQRRRPRWVVLLGMAVICPLSGVATSAVGWAATGTASEQATEWASAECGRLGGTMGLGSELAAAGRLVCCPASCDGCGSGCEQREDQWLVGLPQVMKIRHGMILAQLALALAARRLVIGRVLASPHVKPSSGASEKRPVSRRASWKRRVERVNAERHGRAYARLVADAEQMIRSVGG